MNKLFIIILFVVSVGTAQISQTNLAGTAATASDSLAEVFPLAVGNQWTYGYCWEYNDLFKAHPMYHSCDTGSVTIQIIGKTTETDSILWTFQQESNLCSQYNEMPFSTPQITIDTIEIVELLQGNHQLYRTGDVSSISNSIFPFIISSDPYDSIQITRNQIIDSNGSISFNFLGDFGFTHAFSFEKGKGLTSVITHSTCLCGETWYGNHTLRSSNITSVPNSSRALIPKSAHLEQNYPNPFNPATTISFNLPAKSFVTIKIYDVIGKEVATIVSEEMQAGNYTRQWNAFDSPSGMYFCRMQTGSFTETRKLILIK
jgi:hypothetical protein